MTRAHLACCLVVALAACGGDAPKPAPAATPGAPSATATGVPAAPSGAAATTPAAASPAGTPCYLAEAWDECGLIKRLENAGTVPRIEGRDPKALGATFHAPFVSIAIGRGRLKAFIYPSAAAAQADLAKADTAKQGTCPPLPNARYGGALLHSANLVALLEADNENTCVRITDLVTAGLPRLERR
jgi:hypothetical protein